MSTVCPIYHGPPKQLLCPVCHASAVCAVLSAMSHAWSVFIFLSCLVGVLGFVREVPSFTLRATTKTFIHPFIHTYIHTYVHTYIHTYIHTLKARSDTFLLLRVAARLTRGSRVLSYVVRQARTPTIRAVLFRQQRQSSSAQSGYIRGRRQAPPQAKPRHSLLRRWARWIRRRRKRETERRRAGKRRIETSTLGENFCFQIRTASAKERADGAKRTRRPWKRRQGGSRRPTTGAYAITRAQQSPFLVL